MTDEKEERRQRIEAAAYAVLEEKGFKGASMLAVARAAKASNETLYNWYGDKVGLFASLIARNTAQVADELTWVRGQGGRGLEALERLGLRLVQMVTGERAVALNRAAAADMSRTLGAALGAGGRETVRPLLCELVDEALQDGQLSGETVQIVETYLALLIGDLQIRRAIGVLEPLGKKEAMARSERAMAQLKSLYPA